MANAVSDPAYAQTIDEQLKKLRTAIEASFWNEQRWLFETYFKTARVHFAELTQSLAILAGVGSEARHASLREKLMSSKNQMTPTTLRQPLYNFEALLIDPACTAWVRESMIRDWSAMLFAGATRFWETRNGGWDFQHVGSLCHRWSAIPVYLLGAYKLV